MSAPESERELLLSASLDGELGPEEQAMLDRWLREDAALARRRDELVEQRAWLRQSLGTLRSSPLGPKFAERVIEAAIARADSEGLPAEHPLVKLRDRETMPVEPKSAGAESDRTLRRWAAVAALAAALLLSWVVVQRLIADHPFGEGEEIALNATGDGQPGDTANGLDGIPTGPDIGSLARDTDGLDRAADPNLDRVPELAGTGDVRTAEPPTASIAQATPDRTVTEPSTSRDGEVRPRDGVVDGPGMVANSNVGQVAIGDPAVPEARLRAVLFVSVELTAEGRRLLALTDKFRQEGIRLGEKAILSGQTVRDLERLRLVRPEEAETAGTLYFVQAPARQLDRFLLSVMDDDDAVASFGMSIVEDESVLRVLARLQSTEPAEAEVAMSGSFAHDLVLDGDRPLRLTAGDQVVGLPRTGDSRQWLGMFGNPAVPNDFASQMLLLVR